MLASPTVVDALRPFGRRHRPRSQVESADWRRSRGAPRVPLARVRANASGDQSFANPDTPEAILRVSKRTSFEGLKAARRVESASARERGDVERLQKVEWAYEALIAESRAWFDGRVKDNDGAEARFQLGNFYQTLEKYEDAEREYRHALTFDAHADAANNLAMLLQERGDVDEAEAYYILALKSNENNVDVLFNWATLKLNCRQDLDATRVLIEKIVAIQPDLKKHPLVKALREEEDDDDREPFVFPI